MKDDQNKSNTQYIWFDLNSHGYVTEVSVIKSLSSKLSIGLLMVSANVTVCQMTVSKMSQRFHVGWNLL